MNAIEVRGGKKLIAFDNPRACAKYRLSSRISRTMGSVGLPSIRMQATILTNPGAQLPTS
jgi:hypothetical protein